ncbi:hypothetical protein [Pseudoxanthomonas sp.]|uniref:hypothetical protein n=1 Tax=Pseudoxanthomonas sp. TaxID=1871049 RepID=UPI0025FAAA99|nr:hypothetical protein [Pseudoxanthomonas sp.]
MLMLKTPVMDAEEPMQKRCAVLPLMLLVSACSSLSVPTTGTYTEPGSGGSTASVLVKELQQLDTITFPAFQIAKVVLAPGRRTVSVSYFTTDRVMSHRVGGASLTHDFQPGKAYIVRYRRTDAAHFRAWIEDIDPQRTVSVNTNCMQPIPWRKEMQG